MNKSEAAEWAVKRIIKFSRDLAYVAPELYPEKFEILARDIWSEILKIEDTKSEDQI